MIDFNSAISYSQDIRQTYFKSMGRGRDCCCAPGEMGETAASGDILDLKNSRHLPPGPESLMAMIEKHVNVRVEHKFTADDAEEVESEAPVDDYWSPENTAGRIVDFALKFYDKYSEAKGGESVENLDSYLELVRGAIGEGIGQAEEVIADQLGGGELPEKNRSLIDRTRLAIEDRLEAFRAEVMDRLTVEPGEVPETDASTDTDTLV